MSGGSMNYLCWEVEGWADRLAVEAGQLLASDDVLRQVFGRRLDDLAGELRNLSEPLRSIEWVDSGDYIPGEEHDALREFLGIQSAESPRSP